MIHTKIRRQGMAIYQTLVCLEILTFSVAIAGLVTFDVPYLFALLCFSAAGAILLLVSTRRKLADRFLQRDAAESDSLITYSKDSLTGARSRQSFLTELAERVNHGSRSTVSLLLIDVDHFKSINDSLGHGVGDAVLRHLVDTASTTIPSGSISRLGGDEFAILMEDCESEWAATAADRFLDRLRVPTMIAGRQVTIGASIGIATSPHHTIFGDELMLCADLALYESKRRGRGTFTVFDDTMMADQKYRRFIERELRAAILLDELELHYQPVVDGSKTTIAVEALVRWRHPVRGLMAPDSFIPIAEQSTLIDRLGEWVFSRACRDATSLPGHRIGINVSAAQLRRDALIEGIEAGLKKSGLPAERFVFEITESVALSADASVLRRIDALQALGAKVVLDDVGTGHFGFSSIRTLPVGGIKVDRSYIQAMGSDEIAGILVTALGAVGRAKNISVVAEGIETEEQFVLAKTAGCTAFQGYFLGRPVPLAALVDRQTALAA